MPSSLERHVDVLIVGTGPSGLMAAAWLARHGISFRIIDRRNTRLFAGQADGLQSRTLEILDFFGANDIWQDANKMLEMCMWSPNSTGVITRAARMIDTIKGISRFQQATLHQGRIEQALERVMSEHADIEVERCVLPVSLDCDESQFMDDYAYPITVRLSQITEDPATPPLAKPSSLPNGMFRSNLTKDDNDDLVRLHTTGQTADSLEIVRAKYLIGCDGAHSWVRKELGIRLEGAQTDYIWGVLDIIPITDFPDIRQRCAIHSAESGSMMIIPRENKLVRIYCQLREINKGSKVNRAAITPEQILARAQEILAPYQITYESCSWFTAYQIGQRVASTFHYGHRIFLAGDAVHTHSPKAGQGMNVSMQDTYNLGWKIGSVVKGISRRSILETYEDERRMVAQDLIDFDHKLSRLFSGRPAKDATDKEGVNMEDFRAAYAKGNIFTSGVAVQYKPSLIVRGGKTSMSTSHLATKITFGARISSQQILNQSDARPCHLQELLRSDGRWRLLVFAGDVARPAQMLRLKVLASRLSLPTTTTTTTSNKNNSNGSHGLLSRFTPSLQPIDSVIEVLTIHSARRTEVEVLDFPEVLRPFKAGEGWDYWKIYVDDESHHCGHGRAYEKLGIDRERGCLVVVRPDQHVNYVGELEDVDVVEEFFAGVLVARG